MQLSQLIMKPSSCSKSQMHRVTLSLAAAVAVAGADADARDVGMTAPATLWLAWFDGMTFSAPAETMLTGE